MGRLVRGVVIALASAAWFVVPVPMSGTEPPARAAPGNPTTGFEESNGARWTTPDEEAGFLHSVERARPEVSIDRIGSSVQGRPLRLVNLGSRASATTVLFVCSQHGDEPSGREACLSRIRDLAYSPDGETRRFLDTTNVLFVPNANPDGQVANTRENAAGVDINRDHLALASPESRAVGGVIRDRQPDVLHDLHEYGAQPPYYTRDLLSLWPRNLNMGESVHGESERLSEQYVRPLAEQNGFSTGVYGIWTDPDTGEPIKQVAGDGQERILRNTTGVKHALGLLVEARSGPLTDAEKRDPALNNRRRVDSQLGGMHATRAMLSERRGEIEHATTQARAAGLLDRGPVYFGGADNEPPAPGDVVQDPPCGYRLSSEQFRDIRDELALHGVRSIDGPDDERYVPLRQESRALAALLLDPRAEHGLAAAEPVSSEECSIRA